MLRSDEEIIYEVLVSLGQSIMERHSKNIWIWV